MTLALGARAARWTHGARRRLHALQESRLRLDGKQRLAVDMAIGAAFFGIVVALADPHLPPLRRVGRLLIDVFVLGGLTAYLQHPEAGPRTWTGWRLALHHCERALLMALGLAGLAYVIWAPVDPFLKMYRISLALVLIVALAADVRRPVPRGWFKGIVGLQATFALVEAFVLVYAMATVDGPLAAEGGKRVIRGTTDALLSTGLAAPQEPALTGAVVRSGLVRVRDGRMYGTDGLYDLMRFVDDDPINALVIVARSTTIERSLRSFVVDGPYLSLPEQCGDLARIGSPVRGYRLETDADTIAAMARICRNLQSGWGSEQ